MSTINLKFGSPDHGWLIVELSCNQNKRTLDVSDVPPDSLCMLATAVLRLVEGKSTEVLVEWSLEPDYETWILRRSGDAYELDIRAPGPDNKIFRFAEGGIVEICFPILRALKSLAADPVWCAPTADLAWSNPFPAQVVAALSESLKSL
jgi:hypothetical protein